MKLKTTMIIITLIILTNKLYGSHKDFFNLQQFKNYDSSEERQQIQIQIPVKNKKPINLLEIVGLIQSPSSSSSESENGENSPYYRKGINKYDEKYSNSMLDLPLADNEKSKEIENQFNNQPIKRHKNVIDVFPTNTKSNKKNCKYYRNKYKEERKEIVNVIREVAKQVGTTGKEIKEMATDTTRQGEQIITQGLQSLKTAGRALKITFCNTITSVLALGIGITGVYLSTMNQEQN
jgi:hypothetical protein